MKLIIINKVDIDYMEMCRFPKFDFNLELFKSLLIFDLKRNYVSYFWTKIFDCL